MRPTSQITKGLMKNKKKKLLVIAEICCPQEIKAPAPLAHAINISFVLAYRHRNLWNITKCQRCFSVPPPRTCKQP